MLSHLPKLYFKDAIEQRDRHVGFDMDLFNQNIYNLELQVITVMKVYLKEVNYLDKAYNKDLLKAFFTFFDEIHIEMHLSKKT